MASIRHENLQFPNFPTLTEDICTDILIIGGGIQPAEFRQKALPMPWFTI